MRILVVHETEYLEKVVFEFQIIPEILASRGHEVVVVDYPQHWQRYGWYDWGWLVTRRFDNVRKARKQAGIQLIRPGILKVPVLSRFVGVITHFVEIGKQLGTKKYDAVLLYSVPTNGVSTLLWARIFGVPVVFRLLDVLHEIVPHMLFKFPTLVLESLVYTCVHTMSTTTPRLSVYAKKLAMNKIEPVYLDSGADTDVFAPHAKPEKLMRQIGLRAQDRVALFAGTLYRFSGLLSLIYAMPNYLKHSPNTKLLIVGHGEQEQVIAHEIERLKLSQSVIMTGFVDYEHLGSYVNMADVGVNPFEINAITDDIIPAKVYQYLASGLSVIATPLSGLKQVFDPEASDSHGVYYAPSGALVWEYFDRAVKHKQRSRDMPSLQETATTLEMMMEKAHEHTTTT